MSSLVERKMIRRYGAVLLVLLGTAACASARARPQVDTKRGSDSSMTLVVREMDSVGIHGIVRDQNGRLLQGAAVVTDAKHAAANTDSLGRFRMQLPPGLYALRTLHVGYERRTDSIRVPSAGGLALEIPMHEAAAHRMSVCACDPVATLVVTLEIQTEDRAPIRYAIVTTRIAGETSQRDSIPGRDFINGTATRRILAFARDGAASVEVRAPGYRMWQDRADHLPANMYAVLKPQDDER